MSDSDTSGASNAASGRKQGGPSTWWQRWIIRPALVLTGLGLAGLLSGVLLVGVGLSVAYPNLPDVKGLTDYRPKMPLRVYSADNTLIGEFGEEKRNFLPITEIPQVMRDAVLAIGNAPTALFRLLELLDEGAPVPAAVLGGPVGFVGSAQSKDELIARPRGMDYLVVTGRRGGSAMAAAAVNAIASERE